MSVAVRVSIAGSVGQDGQNMRQDVSAIQSCLNELMGNKRTALKVDGISGPKTEAMIKDFQVSVLKFTWPDGCVDTNGKTLQAMQNPHSAIVWRSTQPSRVPRRLVLNVHFRMISLTDVSFQSQFQGAVSVFNKYNIDMRFKSGRSEMLSEENRKKFKRVDTSCVVGDDEWSALQVLLNDVPKSDICVFFVGRLWDKAESSGSEMFLGCGAHRPGAPACVVAANGSKYDMAHEVGHVLGLDHKSTSGNLMHPTQATYPRLPKLTSAQVTTIRNSPLCT